MQRWRLRFQIQVLPIAIVLIGMVLGSIAEIAQLRRLREHHRSLAAMYAVFAGDFREIARIHGEFAASGEQLLRRK
jgi:hypothetical protein